MHTKNLFTKPEFRTSFLGTEINRSYKDIVSIFGRHHSNGDGEKVDAEWRLMTKCGIYFTIYNYKDGHSYCGAEGDNIKDITNWHIGVNKATDIDELERIFQFLGLIN